jgi:hypothetical protein
VTAEIDGHPLAQQPDLLCRYAEEIVQRHPNAEPEDVLLWAEAREYAAAEQQRASAEQADQATQRGAA